MVQRPDVPFDKDAVRVEFISEPAPSGTEANILAWHAEHSHAPDGEVAGDPDANAAQPTYCPVCNTIHWPTGLCPPQ